MRTTVDIPADLIKKAMNYYNVKTKTGILINGLNELIHKYHTTKIRQSRGKIKIDIDVKKSRQR